MKMTLLFFTAFNLLNVPGCLNNSDQQNMEIDKYIAWFLTTQEGEWRAIDQEAPIPPKVLNDSKYWNSIILSQDLNARSMEMERENNFLLGLGPAPDKLITKIKIDAPELIVETIETKHQFIIKMNRDLSSLVETSKAAGTWDEFVKSQFNFLSLDASNLVARAFEQFRSPHIDHEKELTFFSSASIPIELIEDWDSINNVVGYRKATYLLFYKARPGTASGPFFPGNDWFSRDLRKKYGMIRDQ